jgi:hypothetical protein
VACGNLEARCGPRGVARGEFEAKDMTACSIELEYIDTH